MLKYYPVLLLSVFLFAECSKNVQKNPAGDSEIKEEKIEAPKNNTSKQTQKEKQVGSGSQVKDNLFDNIYFDLDQYTLTSNARNTLADYAQRLKKNTEIKIQVEGHCDERGTIEYNLSLGERRASAVRSYLVNAGIDARRISTISYGKERPADTRHNEEAWAVNRRAVFIVTIK